MLEEQNHRSINKKDHQRVSSIKRTNQSKNSYVSFNRMNNDQQVQLLRISLKKEIDRKQKLQRLYEKYQSISEKEKSHISNIKSYIIELKGSPDIPKPHFKTDPNIFVNNYLTTATRTFLCKLLNSFYQVYNQNAIYQSQISKSLSLISRQIKKVVQSQDLLFMVEKQNITNQVQLQGQHLKEKNKFREETMKLKQTQQENVRVMDLYREIHAQYSQQVSIIENLKKDKDHIQMDLKKLSCQIAMSHLVHQMNKKKIDQQSIYLTKFDQQVQLIDREIQNEKKRNRQLKKKLAQAKVYGSKKQNKNISEYLKHTLDINMLQVGEKIVLKQRLQ